MAESPDADCAFAFSGVNLLSERAALVRLDLYRINQTKPNQDTKESS
jgi:hypothetical protein